MLFNIVLIYKVFRQNQIQKFGIVRFRNGFVVFVRLVMIRSVMNIVFVICVVFMSGIGICSVFVQVLDCFFGLGVFMFDVNVRIMKDIISVFVVVYVYSYNGIGRQYGIFYVWVFVLVGVYKIIYVSLKVSYFFLCNVIFLNWLFVCVD